VAGVRPRRTVAGNCKKMHAQMGRNMGSDGMGFEAICDGYVGGGRVDVGECTVRWAVAFCFYTTSSTRAARKQGQSD